MKSIKYLFVIATSLLISVSITGCMTGLYLISLPGRFQLNEPEAPRYFQLYLDIPIDKQIQTIQYIWSCEQSPSFSFNTGWRLNWESETGYFVKTFSNGSAVFFKKPLSNYCEEIKDYSPQKVGFIKNTKNIDKLNIYQNITLANTSVIKAVIKRLSSPTPALPITEQEKKLADFLDDTSEGFIGR